MSRFIESTCTMFDR